jgi:hypothetical protein
MKKMIGVLLFVPLWAAFAGSATSEQQQPGLATNGQYVSSKIKRDQRRALAKAADQGEPNTPGGPPLTIQVSASGEILSLGGYNFPPANPTDVAAVDGWELRFEQLLVTLDHIWIASNPDLDPTDQSRTGPRVAQADGPWAIDLHKGGPLPGYGGPGEQAERVTVISNQNLVPGNPPFDPTVRYAIGYDVVRADPFATLINLDPSQYADYDFMVDRGISVLYVGTATWRGTAATCSTTDPSFSFANFPTQVRFRLGWKTPTSAINCQNPSLPGPGIGGEEHPRGVIVSPSTQIVSQMTIHTDHPFWENFDSDGPPAHFDQIAAVARRQGDVWGVLLEDTFFENYTAFPVPWRWCRADLTGYVPPDQLTRMDFELGRYYDPSLPGPLSSYTSYRDYYDLTSHGIGSQAHLNANGLCAVQRGYPSRPGF